MTRRFLLTYLAITAFVLVALAVPLGVMVARNERDHLTTRLERDATVLATMVEDSLEGGSTDGITNVAAQYSAKTDARVIVVDPSGTAVADTGGAGDEGGDVGRDFSSRPEIESALAGTRSSGSRFSETLGVNLQYVTVPVASSGRVHGAVRLTYPTGEVDRKVRGYWIRLVLLSAVVLAAVALIGTLLARSFTRPLRHLESVADTLASGDLTARTNVDSGPHEIRHLAIALDGMAARIQDLLGQQRQFTANVSHDLRTPLTALRLRLENLQDSVGAYDPEDVEAALDETARLSRLVDRLLAFARSERETADRVTGDVGTAAQDRTRAWAPLADERGVTLRCDTDGELVARTVPDAAAQILDNLIANALEVAPEGSEVVVRVLASDGYVEMHVVDAGPGMSEADREAAFERYWRGTSTSDREGTGLGLAIVHQLARAGGGKAGLDEAAGGGLDAWVRFPAAERSGA